MTGKAMIMPLPQDRRDGRPRALPPALGVVHARDGGLMLDGRALPLATLARTERRPRPRPRRDAVLVGAEGGVPSVDLQSGWAIRGPRVLPGEAVGRISDERPTAMLEPEMRARAGSRGIEPMFAAGPAFDAFLARNLARSRERLHIADVQPR